MLIGAIPVVELFRGESWIGRLGAQFGDASVSDDVASHAGSPIITLGRVISCKLAERVMEEPPAIVVVTEQVQQAPLEPPHGNRWRPI